MKLSLSLTDIRVKGNTSYNYGTPQTEDYTRVTIEGAEASAKVTAALLRGIADEIDAPLRQVVGRNPFADGEGLR